MSDSSPEPTSETSRPSPGNVPGIFAQFVDTYYQAAYRFALSLSGNHNDACDITQQAFYLAQIHDDQLKDAGKRKQWLFTILHREFLRGLRRRNSHPEINLEFSEPELPPISVDQASLLDSKDLLGVLQTLDETYRTPLVLFYLNQISYKEIAATLDVPIGTVMSRLARGKQMLRHQLESKRPASYLRKSPFTPQVKADGRRDG